MWGQHVVGLRILSLLPFCTFRKSTRTTPLPSYSFRPKDFRLVSYTILNSYCFRTFFSRTISEVSDDCTLISGILTHWISLLIGILLVWTKVLPTVVRALWGSVLFGKDLRTVYRCHALLLYWQQNSSNSHSRISFHSLYKDLRSPFLLGQHVTVSQIVVTVDVISPFAFTWITWVTR